MSTKGIYTVLNSAKYQKNVTFKFIGGSKKDLKAVNSLLNPTILKMFLLMVMLK